MSIVEQALKRSIKFEDQLIKLRVSKHLSSDGLALLQGEFIKVKQTLKSALAELEQSEPEAWMKHDGSVCSKAFKNDPPHAEYAAMFNTPLFTTPQRQQPLKRLSVETVNKLARNFESTNGFADANMDEMIRINK